MMVGLFAAVMLAAGPPPGKIKACEDRCVASVKICAEQCEKNFPKEKATQCKQACQGSVPGCKDACKSEPPEE